MSPVTVSSASAAGTPPAGSIRLATASPATQGTTQETLAQLEGLARSAGTHRADFLLLPEAYLGGYPRGADFGCKVGGRTAEGYADYAEYFRGAVDLGDSVGRGAGGLDAWVSAGKGKYGAKRDGVAAVGGDEPKNGRGDGTREELERIARETGVFIVVGLVERAGGSLYCAVVYVCPQRGIIGKRRKVMPTGTERLIWAQGSPATLKAVSTTVRGIRVNLAAAICWENYMPLLRQSLYAQNVNLYFAPTADARETWLPLMRTVAIEGRCFVVSSNMCVREGRSQGAAASTAATHPASGNEVETDGMPGSQQGVKPQRRNSCMTEEGFEIALPSATKSVSPVAGSRARRRSVFDEDGHEIVLPCASAANPLSSSAVVESDHEDEDVAPDAVRSAHPKQGGADAVTGTATETVSPYTSGGNPSAADGSTSTNPAPQTEDSNNSTTTTNSEPRKPSQEPEQKFASRGGSSIVSPFGEVLAGPQWEDESGIIYADVDFTQCVRGRLDLDVAGSYSRNDAFNFSVEGLNLDPLPYY